MAHRILWSALGAVLASTLFVACSDDAGSTDNPGGSQGQAGAAPGAGSGGKSNPAGGDSSQAGDSPTPMGGGGSSTGGPVADAFWEEFAGALCHRYFHCPDAADPEAHSRLRAEAKTEARCTTLLLERVLQQNPHVAALNSGVASGALHLQESWLQTCLDTAKLCNYPYDQPGPGEIMLENVAPCREVFEGTVAAGGDCDISEECEGDAMCVTGDAGACTGQCAPRLEEGAVCSVNRQCSSPPEEWAACNELRCEAFEVGVPNDEGTSCTTFSNQKLCKDDLWCAGTGCTPALALDDACDPATLPLSVCLDGRCTADKCTAYTVGTQAGDPCDAESQLCDSFAGLACAGGQCAKATSANCTQDYWFERSWCAGPKLLGVGQACTKPDACQSGICSKGACAASLCSAP